MNRPVLINIETDEFASFHVEENILETFDAPYHFHPEIELVYIVESMGKRFVGTSIESFRAGDLVLVGPNLPHAWINDPDVRRAHAVVVQFLPDCFGKEFFRLGEMRPIGRLLARASRGILFPEKMTDELHDRLMDISSKRGIERFLLFMEILAKLAGVSGQRMLSGPGERLPLDERASERIDRVIRLVVERYAEPIALADAARAACMSPSAFCRYFRGITGHTFIAFLNMNRVDAAARLLVETDHSVTEVCFHSGFSNISNFNRRFRERKGVTPTEYRRLAEKCFQRVAQSGASTFRKREHQKV